MTLDRKRLEPTARRPGSLRVGLVLGCAMLLVTSAATQGDTRHRDARSTAAQTTESAAATTGRKLLDHCSRATEDAGKDAWCEAYIIGVVEGLFGTRAFPSRCVRAMPHSAEIRRLVVEFANMANLEGDDYAMRRPAPLLIRDILTVRYCG